MAQHDPQRQIGTGQEPTSEERRTAPEPLKAHLFDILFFRLLALAILANEIGPKQAADWHVLVAGFGMFFMPDAIRGRNSLPLQLVRRWIETRA